MTWRQNLLDYSEVQKYQFVWQNTPKMDGLGVLGYYLKSVFHRKCRKFQLCMPWEKCSAFHKFINVRNKNHFQVELNKASSEGLYRNLKYFRFELKLQTIDFQYRFIRKRFSKRASNERNDLPHNTAVRDCYNMIPIYKNGAFNVFFRPGAAEII